MGSPWLRRLLLASSTLVAAVLGAADAGLRTAAGRSVVVRAALGAANNAIDGRLSVGKVQGSVRHGLEATDVTIEGPDGTELARIPSLSVRYRLRDLLVGRIVLGQLTLNRPYVNLVQQPGGRLNVEDILRMGKGGKGGGRSPLVAFSGVEITDATVSLHTLVDSTQRVPEREDGPHGRMRVRRIEGLDAHLPYLRLSSPLATEHAFRIEISELKTRISDPTLDLRGAKGVVEIDGTTARLDLSRADLPGTSAKVRGTISWGGRTLQYDLAVETEGGSVNDIRGLAPDLPTGLEASGAFVVRTLPRGAFEFRSEAITLVGTGDGGRLTGRFGFVLGPGSSWAARNTDVALDNFDLEYLRPILDTLPVAGRLSGTLQADGPRESLSVNLDWAFRDSLVAGWPETQVRANGAVSLGVPGKFVFRGLAIEQSRIDLGTVRRLLPAVKLRGILQATGTLNGPWLQPEFGGTLRHRDAPLPESVARGVVRVDARRDTIGVWTTLAWDSLSLEGFHLSYPQSAVTGTFSGETRLSGYADSLGLNLDLGGPAGRLVGGGALTLVGPHFALRGLDLELRGGSLHELYPSLPPSRLFGRVTGALNADTLAAPTGRLVVKLDSSLFAGARVDSARAVLSTADSILRLDSLRAWAPAARLSARGGLGLGGSQRDSLVFVADADSVHGAEPFVRWLLALAPDTARGGPTGSARVRGTLAGRLSDFRVGGEATIPRLGWGRLTLARARIAGEWRSTAQGVVTLDGTAESTALGRYRVAALALGLTGRRDSLGWTFASRLGDSARVLAGGRAHGDSLALALSIDSLRLDLPVQRWRADTGAVVIVTDSNLAFRQTLLASADGGARLAIGGTFPLGGSGHLHLTVEQLPFEDLLAVLQRNYEHVGGALSGNFDLRGTAALPVMEGAFSVVNGVFGDFNVPQMEGSLSYQDKRLQGNLALRRLGEHLLDLDLDLPLDLALQDVAERRLEAPLHIRGVADSVDLAFAEALTPQMRKASGRLDADIGIGGTWTRPELAGTLNIAHGAVSLPSVGSRYEELNGKLVLNGDTIRVESLSLQSMPLFVKGPRGSLALRGYVRLEQLSRPVLDLHLAAQDFHLMDVRNFLSAVVAADLNLTGPVVGATLTGHGTMTKGVLYFADLVTKQVVNLQDTLFRDVLEDTSLIRRQGLGPAFHNVFWDSLRIDNLGVDMGSDAWLRSNEANIQLAGSVTVEKQAAIYRLDGTLTTTRGTYRLSVPPVLSREFTVTSGQVQYFGTPDLNAGLDVDAQYVVKQRSESDIAVTVHLGGTLYVPKLSLSSDARPPLSDAEVITLLVSGSRSGNQGGVSRAAAQVGSALSGVLVGQVENQLGSLVSNLGLPFQYVQINSGDLSQGFASSTQIAVGTQLGQNLLLRVSSPICGAASTSTFFRENLGASLEFRLSKQWRAAASIDPVGSCGNQISNARRQGGVDLFWEKRF